MTSNILLRNSRPNRIFCRSLLANGYNRMYSRPPFANGIERYGKFSHLRRHLAGENFTENERHFRQLSQT